MTTAHQVRDEARRRLAALHGGNAGCDVTIKALNTVIRMLAPQNQTLAKHVALLARSNELEDNPPADIKADHHWKVSTEYAEAPVLPRPNVVTYAGHRLVVDDMARLAVALACANAAIAAGVQANDYKWHHGATEFAWPEADGGTMLLDAPGMIAFGARVLSAEL